MTKNRGGRPKGPETQRLNITLPLPTAEKLTRCARWLRVSKSALLTYAVESYAEKQHEQHKPTDSAHPVDTLD